MTAISNVKRVYQQPLRLRFLGSPLPGFFGRGIVADEESLWEGFAQVLYSGRLLLESLWFVVTLVIRHGFTVRPQPKSGVSAPMAPKKYKAV